MNIAVPKNPLEQHHVVFSGSINEFSEIYQRANTYGQLLIDFRFAKKYFLLINHTDVHVIPTNSDADIFHYYEQLEWFDSNLQTVVS